ncbi:MAG: YfhO family protein, partial [Oscillospiraceae bacterium]|nr:YfhO family protein [Oscillospiraceae bacterium]
MEEKIVQVGEVSALPEKKTEKKKRMRAERKETGFLAFLRRNKFLFIAFIIPVAVVYGAYILFEIFPFGDSSVLVLDLNAQYVYFFEGLRDAIWDKTGSVFYNWSGSLSGGYIGIIAYYLASPFTLIAVLLPRTMILGSLLIIQLAKIGTCGLTFYYFITKSKGMRDIHAVIFSTVYALSSYMVVQLIDLMWLDGPAFLPLILLGVERLVDGKKKLGYIIPLGIMFLAHFYIGYMVGIFTVIYFLYYMFFASDVRRNSWETVKTFVRFGLCSAVSLLCACAILIPIYNALKLGKFDFSEPDLTFRSQFFAFDFFHKLLPASYDTVHNEGMPMVYSGVLTLILVPVYFMNRKIESRKKIGNLILMTLLFLFMYIKPVDIVMHGFQQPNWIPFRYSFLFSFVVIAMAAHAFIHLESVSKKSICGTVGVIVAYLFIVDRFGEYENVDTMGTVWFTVVCLAAFAIMLGAAKDSKKSSLPAALILIVVMAEMLINSYQTFLDIHDDVVYTKRSNYYENINPVREMSEKIIEGDPSLFRAEKTFNRSSNDPLGVKLRGMTHSTSVMNTKTLDFVGGLGYSYSSFYTKYRGATPLADSLLGFKYVLDREGNVPRLYEKQWESDEGWNGTHTKLTTVYKNPDALSVGYMASDKILSAGKLGKLMPFDNQNKVMAGVVGKDVEQYFKSIPVGNPTLGSVTTEPYTNLDTKYIAKETGDPTVEYHITAPNDSPVYLFIPTSYEHKVNLWVSTEKNSAGTGFANFSSAGQYFEGENFSIRELGHFEPNTEFALRITVFDEYSI